MKQELPANAVSDYLQVLNVSVRTIQVPQDGVLNACSDMQILLFTAADCMLTLSSHLYALDQFSVVVIPPDSKARFLYGHHAQFYSLQFAVAPQDPLDLCAQIQRLCRGLPHLRLSRATHDDMISGAKRLMELVHLSLGHDKAAYARLYDMLVILVAHGKMVVQQTARTVTPSMGLALEVKAYLDLAYTQPITLQNLAQRFYVSPSHLCRAFKAQVGLTLFTYLNDLRIRHAAALLQEGASCTRARDESGYATSQHFIAQFRKRLGHTPGKYRILCRKALA